MIQTEKYFFRKCVIFFGEFRETVSMFVYQTNYIFVLCELLKSLAKLELLDDVILKLYS